MSRTVPTWLSHLRTDRRGLPVPYVNLWGDQDIQRVSIGHDTHVGGPGVFLDDSQETMPDFTRQNMGRQRECVAAGLCQVCARFVPWSRRFVIVADMSVERIDYQGRQVAVVIEPWLCERCAKFAIDTCPALIRRNRDEVLTLVPVTTQRQTRIFTSRGWLEGPLEAESRRIQPAMWAKVALLHYPVVVVDRFPTPAHVGGKR